MDPSEVIGLTFFVILPIAHLMYVRQRRERLDTVVLSVHVTVQRDLQFH